MEKNYEVTMDGKTVTLRKECQVATDERNPLTSGEQVFSSSATL